MCDILKLSTPAQVVRSDTTFGIGLRFSTFPTFIGSPQSNQFFTFPRIIPSHTNTGDTQAIIEDESETLSSKPTRSSTRKRKRRTDDPPGGPSHDERAVHANRERDKCGRKGGRLQKKTKTKPSKAKRNKQDGVDCDDGGTGYDDNYSDNADINPDVDRDGTIIVKGKAKDTRYVAHDVSQAPTTDRVSAYLTKLCNSRLTKDLNSELAAETAIGICTVLKESCPVATSIHAQRICNIVHHILQLEKEAALSDFKIAIASMRLAIEI